MGSRRSNKGRAFVAAAATSIAAASMILLSAPALADDAAAADSDTPTCVTPRPDGDCPLPGTQVLRTAPRGAANAGPSGVFTAPRGTPLGDGSDTGAKGFTSADGKINGQGEQTADGSPTPLCFANRTAFGNDPCNLPTLTTTPYNTANGG